MGALVADRLAPTLDKIVRPTKITNLEDVDYEILKEFFNKTFTLNLTKQRRLERKHLVYGISLGFKIFRLFDLV